MGGPRSRLYTRPTSCECDSDDSDDGDSENGITIDDSDDGMVTVVMVIIVDSAMSHFLDQIDEDKKKTIKKNR